MNFATEEEAKKHDSLIKHRLRYERESFKKEDRENENGTECLTLEQAYLLYLKQKQFSKKSLYWQMDAMRGALELYGRTALGNIGFNELAQIMETLQSGTIKSVTVRGRMSVLRTVMRWCADQGYCDPVRFPKLPPAQYEKFIPPTPQELDAIMSVADEHIQRVVILGAQCGVRVGPSELLKLHWDDVDLELRILRIHGAKKNLAAPWREVPIRDGLVPILQAWKEADEQTGITRVIHYKGKAISSIKTAWASTLDKAGITRRIRPYDLRHAFATELIAAGADIGTVAKLMGHSSPAMILNHYQYVMDKQKRAAVEALPEISYVPKTCAQEKRHLQ